MTIVSFVAFTLFAAFLTYMITRKDEKGTSDGFFLGGRSFAAQKLISPHLWVPCGATCRCVTVIMAVKLDDGSLLCCTMRALL